MRRDYGGIAGADDYCEESGLTFEAVNFLLRVCVRKGVVRDDYELMVLFG